MFTEKERDVKYGLFQDAHYLFEEIPQRDHVFWTSILTTFNLANFPSIYATLLTQLPCLTYLSEAKIFLNTSINNPTAASVPSSENTSPALITEILRLRQAIKSMWLVPALAVTTSLTEGSSWSSSSITGAAPEQRMA